jgi:hypothetical protein
VYEPAVVLAGMASFIVVLAVWLPSPVPAVALNSFVAVGATVAAGMVYGKLTFVVASVHVTDVSQATVGADTTVTAGSGSVLPPAVANVVEVAVMFHPAPEPVWSLTANACELVVVWSTPVSVALNATVLGCVIESVPPVMAAVPFVASAAPGSAMRLAAATAVASAMSFLGILDFLSILGPRYWRSSGKHDPAACLG